jgi:hypothetical protein
MPIMSPRWVLLLSAVLLASGCQVTTQLGQSCVLVKKKDATSSTPVLEKDIAPKQDFISFGATDCEDLICVRDAESPHDPDPEAVALGYCSQECVEGSSSCTVTSTDVDTALKDRMTCRSLLLDQASLERLKKDDPVAYRNTFGETNSPYFCAGKLSTLPAQ